MKESYLYKKLEDKKLQCLTCAHKCIIPAGNYGMCGVRKNINGKLCVLNYGKAISESVDPIEKKPLFHFLPGSRSLSIAAIGCNFRCNNCQNWQISQSAKTDKASLELGQVLSSEKIVEDAVKNRCLSISYTYTEPTVFLEYALDTMVLARERNIKNVWVTNGFMSNETLKLVLPYLDAANVDLKSFDNRFYVSNCGARIAPVLENLKKIKKMGVWLEVTTLVIPTVSDDEKMLEDIAKFISRELGTETPWHISAFSGEISFKMQNIPNTPSEKIYRACDIGRKFGLKYVYSGNLVGDLRENTYCFRCGETAIKRSGFIIERLDNEGKCAKCKESLNIINS